MKRLAIALLAVTGLSVGLSQIASAADLPVKAPIYKAPVVVAPAFSWTGCYVGGNIGYGWESTADYDAQDNPGHSYGSHTGTGWAGGGQIGCDYQMGNWVLGAQGMFDWAGINGSHQNPDNPTEHTLGSKANWFGTLTGRIGYAVQPQFLVYLKGGAAWVHNTYSDVCACTGEPPFWGSASSTRTGWTVGSGAEYAFHRNWSVFLEYDYMDFGSGNTTISYVVLNSPPATYTIDYKHNLQIVLVGLNFRFGDMKY